MQVTEQMVVDTEVLCHQYWKHENVSILSDKSLQVIFFVGIKITFVLKVECLDNHYLDTLLTVI